MRRLFYAAVLGLYFIDLAQAEEILKPVQLLSGTITWRGSDIHAISSEYYRMTFERTSKTIEAIVLSFPAEETNAEATETVLALPVAGQWRPGDSLWVVIRAMSFSSLAKEGFGNDQIASGVEITRVFLGTTGDLKFSVIQVPFEYQYKAPFFQVMLNGFARSSVSSDKSRDPFLSMLIVDPVLRREEPKKTSVFNETWGRIKLLFRAGK